MNNKDMEKLGIEHNLKPLTELNRKYSDVYLSLIKYKEKMPFYEKFLKLNEDFFILNKYAIEHMQPVIVPLLRTELYFSCDRFWNSNRVNLLKSLKTGSKFSFDKVSWWTSSADYLETYEVHIKELNNELPDKPWIYVFWLDNGIAADLSCFSYNPEFLIPETDFTVIQRKDFSILRKTLFVVKQNRI